MKECSGRFLAISLAIVAGEVTLILLTTVAQEFLVDGVSIENSSLEDLTIGGIATLGAAVVSGFVASFVCNGISILPHIIISSLVMLESWYLIETDRINNPVWFAIASAIGLVGALWVGQILFARSRVLKTVTARSNENFPR